MLNITVIIVLFIFSDTTWVKAVLVTHFFQSQNTRNAHDDSLRCVTWRCERTAAQVDAEKDGDGFGQFERLPEPGRLRAC